MLFDVATGKAWSLAHASPDKVVRIAFKEDGTLVTAESDGHVRFWNASTGQPLGSPKQLAKSRFLINPGNPPFGKAKLVVWNVATGQIVFSPEEKKGLKAYGGAVSISADVVAVGGSNFISFVNPDKGGIVDHWRGIPGAVIDLAASADGKQLASTGWDGVVRFWDRPRQENPATYELQPSNASELSFSPSGEILAFAHPVGVVLRHSANFLETHRLDSETRPVFSPTGNLLATISAFVQLAHNANFERLPSRSGQPLIVLLWTTC